MVVLTDLIATAAVSAAVTMVLMFIFYRFWILPYLTEISLSIPSSVKELVFPYVDQMKDALIGEVKQNVDEVTKAVKTTSARFQRTVNQAAAALDLDDIDILSEEGQQAAKEKLTRSYGADVAMQAVSQLIQSLTSKKKDEPPTGGKVSW